MKRPLLWILSFSLLVTAYSCKKGISGDQDVLSKKIAPDGFNFATTKNVDLNLRLLAANNAPIKGAMVSIFIPKTSATDGVFFKAVSDINGYVKGSFSVPSYLDTLTIEPNYPGLISKARALITNTTLTAVIGGSKGFGGSIVPEPVPVRKDGQSTRVLALDVFSGLDFSYPSPYTNSANATNNNGVPNYLETTPDVIDPSLLSMITASLPNGLNVANHHPQYLSSPAGSIDIAAESDVTVTFVSEGADYHNTLCFYTYPTSNPPTAITAAQVGNVKVVFPNASATGSGGNLNPGDKVKIGHFSAGTSVGFLLLQDAWNGSDITFNKNPTEGVNKFFTTADLNPEGPGDPSYAGVTNPKRHAVMMYDNVHHVFLFGFEDTHRTNQYINVGGNSSDHDFNDLLFYCTPEAAFDHTNVPLIDGGGPDTDGDGVPDVTDEFPNDPERAYTQTTYWNTVAFEDLWPSTGDYDLNDVVVQYRYKYVKNAANNIVEFYGEYKPLAAGAYYKDGFGVEFPFSPSIVQSVTGQSISGSYINLKANGVEDNQTKAVIIPFDNYANVLANANPSDIHVNTNMAYPKVTGTTVNVLVKFTAPVSPATVGDPSGFNPFIICRMIRGYEVHLPGRTPTSLAQTNLLGTMDDASNPGAGVYYKTANQWPWAINIAGTFVYPTEGTNISAAYLHFLDWAQSGGSQYPDWYLNTDAGYRVTGNTYTK